MKKITRTHLINMPAAILAFWLRLRQISQKVLNVALATPARFLLIFLVSLKNPKFRFRHIYEMGSSWFRLKFGGSKKWDQKAFVDSVYSLMQEQEKKNPSLKQVHAKLSPEWDKTHELIGRILTANDETACTQYVEELVAMGEVGTRALVEVLLKLKAGKQ